MTDSMTPGDQARVTVGVAVPPEEAFRVFTQEVDLWWRRGRRFRNAPGEQGIVCIEPGVPKNCTRYWKLNMGLNRRQRGARLVRFFVVME